MAKVKNKKTKRNSKSTASKTCKSIVKREGHIEEFDEKKVYASAYWAARSTHLSDKEAEKIALSVSKNVKKWALGKSEIDSNEIFLRIGNELQKHDRDVAFMYLTHRDLS